MADEFDQVIETPWVNAPAESHVQGFRFVNRAFAGGGESEIIVTFNGSTTKKGKVNPPRTYKYSSSDHLGLRMIFERMSIASHPGEIIHADLIRTNVHCVEIT